MILVDSTIWIEFLKSNPCYLSEMETLLESKKVVTIEPVFAELLYGSRNDKERNRIISYWKVLPKIEFKEGHLIESAEFANKGNFLNLGIGLIDAILINAITKNKCLIWTLDKKILINIEKQFVTRALIYQVQFDPGKEFQLTPTLKGETIKSTFPFRD